MCRFGRIQYLKVKDMDLDRKLYTEFDNIKDRDEQILWCGKPKFIPYISAFL